jgi:hypothetical protein
MTTVGDILDEFFSPLSSETLWVMAEDDNYTKIVRKWDPVIQSVNRTKFNLSTSCSVWQSLYVSRPSWKPTMTDSPKPGAYRDFVPSPPGTDPETCKSAFIVYVTSGVAKSVIPGLSPLPAVQTDNLYTCSVGSFNIYTTVDTLDCAAKTATMNFWMYNSMSRRSFGRFASHPAFALSRLKTQYMWWNWVETVDWSSGAMRTVPKTASGSWW